MTAVSSFRGWLVLWLPVWFAGCDAGGGYVLSRCDGVYQAEDGPTVDAVYDRDGDGYVDGGYPDCVTFYGADHLDCDDQDDLVSPVAVELPCNEVDDDCNPDTPDDLDRDHDGVGGCSDCDDDDATRSPAAEESCGDGRDNDCDQVADEQCPPEWGGTFALASAITASCELALVDFEQVVVTWDPPDARMRSDGSGQPGSLPGAIDESGAFVFEGLDELSEACTHAYRFVGAFSDADHLTLSFAMDFEPHEPNGCGDCAEVRVGPVSGTRVVAP